jgi:hypothetical protein
MPSSVRKQLMLVRSRDASGLMNNFKSSIVCGYIC